MKGWSRRKFIETGVVASIAIGGGMTAKLSSALDEGRTEDQKTVLEARESDLLRAAMDELIPAGDGMPAASEVGGLDYLDELASRDKQVAKELRESLTALEKLANRSSQKSFLALSRKQRVESLSLFEKEDAGAFKALREYVYEAYYLQPRVRTLIGYVNHPTNQVGPHVEPFDEAILAEVRKKPKYYRGV
ncbi:MAG: gluconate 2-dehydrogenase subunit 3 family protein [Candidatus Acidiferrales bacterium]